MNKVLFSRLKDKYGSLNPREKWLVNIAVGVLLFFICDLVLISPFRNYNDELASRLNEKSMLLSDIKNYISRKEYQKELYKGKASDFLDVFLRAAKESGLGPVRLKKTENSDKAVLVYFESDGNIQKILDFVLKLEKMEFFVFFQNMEIVWVKGSEYHFEGIIQVIKG